MHALRAWTTLLVLTALLFFPGTAGAQVTRTATTPDALVAGASFFHGKTVVLLQPLMEEGDFTRLADAPKPIYVFWRDRPGSDRGEIRGEFWDLGRIDPQDGRFTGYDFARLVENVNRGRWPTRDQLFVLVNASFSPSVPPRGPTLRAIALAPDDYVDREVTVIGRFKGRNLYAELPMALGKSQHDFVLQSAEGALWVTGVRPRGKGFDLDPSKRVDTGTWLEVTGVVEREGVTTYIEARSLALATEPADAPVEVEGPPVPKVPPPEIIFSAPIQDDHDVDPSSPIRIQFSQDMNPASVRDRVRVSYVAPQGAAEPPKLPAFKVIYNDIARAIEIRFEEPLASFAQVRVELVDGMTAIDGQPLKPWTLTFSTGR